MSKGGSNNLQWVPTVTNQQTSTNTNQNTNTQQQSQTNQSASSAANGLSSNVGGSSGLSLNQIPVWLEQASQAGVQNAANLLNQGVTPYAGELTAGLNNVQNAAGNAYQNLVGSAQPYYDAAGNAISGSMQQGPQVSAQTYANGLQNIGNYMNPYINNVVNSVSNIGQQNLNNALNQTHDQAISANAFGGSRQGVEEGVATAQNNLNTNNLIANLLDSGYNQATSLLGADISNNLTSQQNNQNAYQNYMANLLNGGNALSNLGSTSANTLASQLGNVMNYGNQQQTTQQAADTAGYNNYQYLNNMPQQLQALYNSTVSSAPHSTTQATSGTQYANGATSQTGSQQGQSNTTGSSQSNTTGSSNSNTSGTSMQQQQMPVSNPLMTGLGLAAGLGGMYMSGGSSGFGGLLSGLLGGGAGMSSGTTGMQYPMIDANGNMTAGGWY